MKRTILILSVTIIAICTHAQYNMENLQAVYVKQRSSEDNILKIYPIKANDVFKEHHKEIKQFSNLEKAIKENKIKIGYQYNF